MSAIDIKFQAFIQALTDIASRAFSGVKGAEIRPWDLPEDLRLENNKGFEDQKTIDANFDREGVNKAKTEAVEDRNFPQIAAAHAQGDVLAAARRDYDLRHFTRVRAMAHAAARREKHGSGDGVPTMVLQKWVEKMQGEEASS